MNAHEAMTQIESNLNLILEHIRQSRSCPSIHFSDRREGLERHARLAKEAFDWLDNFAIFNDGDKDEPILEPKVVMDFLHNRERMTVVQFPRDKKVVAVVKLKGRVVEVDCLPELERHERFLILLARQAQKGSTPDEK